MARPNLSGPADFLWQQAPGHPRSPFPQDFIKLLVDTSSDLIGRVCAGQTSPTVRLAPKSNNLDACRKCTCGQPQYIQVGTTWRFAVMANTPWTAMRI